MKQLILISILMSVLLNADYRRDDNGIVLDSETGLYWQDDYSDNGDTVKGANWTDAINYCETLTLGDFDNWRLPNYNELYSLGDRTKTTQPAISEEFVNTVSSNLTNYYWTSTTQYQQTVAWVLSFYNATNHYKNKVDSYYVRCVRDAE